MAKKLVDRVAILEDRMNKRSTENNGFTSSITHLSENIDGVKKSVERVHTRLDQGDITITINNGGLPAKYNLQEFLQSIKDAPMNVLTSGGKIARSISEIVKVLGGFAMFVWVLMQIFSKGNIFH